MCVCVCEVQSLVVRGGRQLPSGVVTQNSSLSGLGNSTSFNIFNDKHVLLWKYFRSKKEKREIEVQHQQNLAANKIFYYHPGWRSSVY